MLQKLAFSALIGVALLFVSAKELSADISVVSNSAQIKSYPTEKIVDVRVETLKEYLEKKNSPLTDYAPEFVYWADVYNLDWRLVPAITGVESSFGKRIPRYSYNAYGWANGKAKFTSWEESIEIVSRTLREKYYNKGALTITQIGRRYAPPSSSWAGKVKYFMNQIDPLPIESDL